MKVIIAGGRDFTDYEKLRKAIAQSGWLITEVVSGGAKGADSLGERWARENNIPVKKFPADWNNLKQKGAVVKTNKWKKQYNANAGFFRNKQMAQYLSKEHPECRGVILMEGGNGTADMKKQAKAHDIMIHTYEMQDEDYEYKF